MKLVNDDIDQWLKIDQAIRKIYTLLAELKTKEFLSILQNIIRYQPGP